MIRKVHGFGFDLLTVSVESICKYNKLNMNTHSLGSACTFHYIYNELT